MPLLFAQQTSDWGAAKLSDAQMDYAASDVLYLHRLMAELQGFCHQRFAHFICPSFDHDDGVFRTSQAQIKGGGRIHKRCSQAGAWWTEILRNSEKRT